MVKDTPQEFVTRPHGRNLLDRVGDARSLRNAMPPAMTRSGSARASRPRQARR
jgi:hypothetical protein